MSAAAGLDFRLVAAARASTSCARGSAASSWKPLGGLRNVSWRSERGGRGDAGENGDGGARLAGRVALVVVRGLDAGALVIRRKRGVGRERARNSHGVSEGGFIQARTSVLRSKRCGFLRLLKSKIDRRNTREMIEIERSANILVMQRHNTTKKLDTPRVTHATYSEPRGWGRGGGGSISS